MSSDSSLLRPKQFLKDIPLLVSCVRTFRYWRNKSLIRRWIEQQKRQGAVIESPLLFKGKIGGYIHVNMDLGVYLENNLTIWISNQKDAHPELKLGKGAFVGQHAYIGVYQPISIGCNAMIGAYSYLISANHRYVRRDIPIQQQGFEGAPIVIEDGAWLGTHVVVLPGVKIGKGAIVGAGSVVTRDIPAWEIWGGVPVQFIKERPQ